MFAKIVRWLLVPVSAAAVVGLVVVVGQLAVRVADARCNTTVGGACVEPWHTTLLDWIYVVGALVVAAGLTVLPSAVAPNLKRSVAVIGGLLTPAFGLWLYLTVGWAVLIAPLAATVLVVGVLLVLIFRGSSRSYTVPEDAWPC